MQQSVGVDISRTAGRGEKESVRHSEGQEEGLTLGLAGGRHANRKELRSGEPCEDHYALSPLSLSRPQTLAGLPNLGK